jgi:two-component system phosphate regulon sensor histidine kinase PhoR
MPPRARNAWFRTLGLLALVLAGGLVVGLLVGKPWPALTVAALGVVAWHYWKLRGVLLRLTARQRIAPPSGDGVWDELDRLLHRAQQDMRSRKRRLLDMLRAYRAAAAALPDAVVIVDRDSQRVVWFNEAATPLLGLRHPRDLDRALGDCLQPLPVSRWLAAGRNAEPMLDAVSPTDPAIRLNLRLIPYSEELWLLVARDVTKLMRLEEMRRQSQRMTQLVEDLLTLSRLESQDEIADDRVAMAPMLATLRREAEALSQGRHRVSVEADSDADLRGSTRELHSAFSNLVSNAVRYTPAGGEITIRYAPTADGGVALSVRDTGYGIPASHLPRITERFYRVSTSRSRELGGTGLGLSIVKHVLNLHQARLAIESEVGAGSTFTCVFGPERVLRHAEAASA